MGNTRRRAAAALLALACTSALVTGCGSDDTDDAADTTEAEVAEGTETTEATDDTGDDGTGDLGATCDAYTAVTTAFSAKPEGDPAEFFETEVTPNLETLESAPPADIEEELGVMVEAAQAVVDSGGEDFSSFEDPAFSEAQAVVDPYMFENCEFDQKLEVAAQDYAFEGLPAELEAGETAMLLTNEGQEAHEIVIMRKAEGTTESWDELLELGEEEAGEKVVPVGGGFAASNGDQGLVIADLEPGEYLAICFVPTGTTVGDDGEHEGDGPPHFVQGMRAEFTVA